MSEYQKTNPTHGQKVTTDPRTQSDPKKEHSGTVLKDSLAAESLENGGDFSKGNPTGISGASSKTATTSQGDDTEGVRNPKSSGDGDEEYSSYHDSHREKGSTGSQQGKGSADDRERRGETDTGVIHPNSLEEEAREGEAMFENAGYVRSNDGEAGKVSASDTNFGGKRDATGQKTSQSSGSERPSAETSGRLAEPGSKEDPGRLAEQHFIEKNQERNAIPRNQTGDQENPYDALQQK